MKYFSDVIEFLEETEFWIKLHHHYYFIGFDIYYSKNSWKKIKKKSLLKCQLPGTFLYKLYFIISQEMTKQCNIISCPIPDSNFSPWDRSFAYKLFVNNRVLPKLIEKLNDYINNNYVIKFLLNIENIPDYFSTRKNNLYFFLKFDHKEIHDEALSVDFDLEEISDSKMIHISKINPLIKSINYKKIYNYVYENILNKEMFDSDSEDFLNNQQVKISINNAKYRLNDVGYIKNYKQAFNYMMEFQQEYYDFVEDLYFFDQEEFFL